ncbi:MAG TPA: DUF192 domain-containing protein [Candidatus Paceibacterota bacterium]|nr:DUF192 domain-containing protein [Candidatus Paceibacterota bacterium]
MRNRKLIFLAFILVVLFLLFYYSDLGVGQCGGYERKQIVIANTTISAEIADNECKRALGLSGRMSLDGDRGMLFKYEGEGSRGIWMKDMNFPIDILWLDKDLNIVGMEWSVSQNTYPKIFGEEYVAEYVLELPVGFIAEHGVATGGSILIK